MAKVKNEIDVDDDDFLEDDDSPETDLLNSKPSQTRRRQIDDYLEERRLQKQLADFDFD